MTYLRKAEAAKLYLAGSALSESQQLRIQDEATRLGVALADAASAITATANQWEAIDANIDNIRLTTKLAITNATTTAAAKAAYAGIVWPC